MAARASIILAAACVLSVAVVSETNAQGRYQPARPTVSPYLNLLRENVGPLPNYHSLVRPMMRQQEFDRQVTQTLNQAAVRFNQLETQATTGVQLRPSGARATGTGSQFGYYSHYFPQPTVRRR